MPGASAASCALLTQVPDVGVGAHVRGAPLELQAGVSHGQLPAGVRVPREVGGRPLDGIGVPLWEGHKDGDSLTALPCLGLQWLSHRKHQEPKIHQTGAPGGPIAGKKPPLGWAEWGKGR